MSTATNGNGKSGNLLDPKQLAARLNVPLSWVYTSAERGIIPSLKLGKYRRFDLAVIEAWLEAQRRSEAVAD